MMRADVHHGAQAEIGFAQGWLGGLVAGRLHAIGAAVHLAPVQDWRDHMLEVAAEIGAPMVAPRRGRAALGPETAVERFRLGSEPGGAITRTWLPCAHQERFPDYGMLARAQTVRCPLCPRAARPKASAAESVRDAWKATACRFVEQLALGAYMELVADARSRARAADMPDHQLVGVSDACEAVGIALYGLHTIARRDSVHDTVAPTTSRRRPK